MLIQADDVEAQLDRSTCFFCRATQHDKAPNHQIKKTTRFFFPDEPTARILYQVRLCLKCLFCCSSPAPYAPNSIILVVSSLGMASKINFYLPTGLA